MTDPNPKNIPAWQKDSSSESELKVIEPKPLPEAPTPTESDVPSSRADLIDQATSWLEHQHIRNAPREGKISFLEGKGLTKEEIHNVLGLKDEEAAIPKTPADTTSSHTADTTIASSIAEPTSSAESSESTPPIITYPEFLLKPPPKPPLVSRTTLLRTAYGTAITAGALHLTSKYLVEPMFTELSSSRHQFYENTSTHLNALNEKLSGVVSVVPAAAKAPKPKSAHGEYDEDTESEASDPAELFHRDIGVQTSEPPSPSSSTPDSSSKGGRVETHSAKLQALRAHLSTLHDSCTDAVDAMQGVEGEMTKLDSLLDELKYARQMYGRKRQGFLPQGAMWMGSAGSDGKDQDTDEIERVKAEIKGVKGVLLSARSFPSTSRPASAR